VVVPARCLCHTSIVTRLERDAASLRLSTEGAGGRETTGLLSRGSQVRVLPGALRFAESFENSRIRSSVPSRQRPSEPVSFRVAARVAGCSRGRARGNPIRSSPASAAVRSLQRESFADRARCAYHFSGLSIANDIDCYANCSRTGKCHLAWLRRGRYVSEDSAVRPD
jgi:hypothetical protein